MEYLLELVDAFKKSDPKALRSVSDKIMANGFVQKDRDLIRLAVVAHSLSKIAEKEYYKRDKEYWKAFAKRIKELFQELTEGKPRIAEIEKEIIELDRHFGRYKQDIIHHSKIRKGSTLYAWGVSLTLASKLVGVPEYELMRHVGKTRMVDEEGIGREVAKRLKDAEEAL